MTFALDQSMFDSLSTKEFLNSRQRSNPYETIKGALFQNRYNIVHTFLPPALPPPLLVGVVSDTGLP